jgi:protein-disulfide isomerase
MEAEVTITVFLSFNCSACSKKFAEIRKLLKSNKKMKVIFIFAPAKDEDGINLTKFILQNYKSVDKDIILAQLEKWYESDVNSRHDLVTSMGPVLYEKELKEFFESNEKMFRENNVTGVPSIFINGFPFPGTYKLNDIKYHIDSIIQLKNEYKANEILI